MKRGLRFFWMNQKILILSLLGCYVGTVLFPDEWGLVFIGIILALTVLANGLIHADKINLILSMGVTRNEYFFGIQCSALCCSVAIALMTKSVGSLSGVMSGFTHLTFNLPLWQYIAFCEFVFIFATALGCITAKHHAWRSLAISIGAFGMGQIVHAHWLNRDYFLLWDGSPTTLAVLMAVVFLAIQCYIWIYIKKYAVK